MLKNEFQKADSIKMKHNTKIPRNKILMEITKISTKSNIKYVISTLSVEIFLYFLSLIFMCICMCPCKFLCSVPL